jgi:eukaryotic-like serine/threonine-protein kinase
LVAEQVAHYRIIEKLGMGGMGEVFLAQDTKLERRVAIKMLPAKSIDDVHARKRLFREAKAAATLDHPNICAIYEVNEGGACPYIVMQYVEGETLAAKFQRAPMPPEEVIEVGIQVAEALAEAHARGVIHRDIKPQNVIITPRGQAKVLDFGLARIAQTPTLDSEAKTDTQLTEEGYIVGTVAYMSPEQLKAMEIDGRSDLFSLGVTLYECATGKPAFTGNSKIEISSKVLQVDPRKPSQLNPGIPPGLEDIILKAMAKDVDARYQSAEEMLQEMRRLRASLSSVTAVFPSVTREASQPIIPAQTRELLRSRKVQIALISIPILLLVAWGAFRIWRGSSYEPSAEAKGWYEQGLRALQEGTYFQASKTLERAVSSDNQYAPAHARLAEAYLEINDERATAEALSAVSLAAARPVAATDAAYLNAISATINRDFAGAIGAYEKILTQAAQPDKAAAYVDLGRAYERNDNTDKAIENYLNATKENGQSPNAFMRLGIAYARRQDLKNAEDAFAQAEKLYQDMSNQEGQVEVLYQRGVLYFSPGKLAEAQAQLEKALDRLKDKENTYQLTKTQLQLSLVYRDEGNIDHAKELAAEEISAAQKSNLKNVATNGLIDLGLAVMSRGDFDDARNYFQQALELARRDGAKASEARAVLSMGRLDLQLSDNDGAIAQLETALKFYQPARYARETSLALTLLGRAHQDKGDIDLAQKYFDEQSQLAQQSSDEGGVAESHMNFALLKGGSQELYPEALAHLDEKLKSDEAHTRKRGIAFDQMNRGRFLGQLGRNAEARAALDAAFDVANQKETGYKTVIAWVHLIRARLALSERNYAEAKKGAQLALETSDSKYPDVSLQAQYTLGLAQALSGAPQAGQKLCEQALESANKLKSRPLITSAQLALAEIFLLEKNADAALKTALEAHAIFAQSGQKDSEWRALLIAARASELAGNKSAAQDYAARADKACNELPQKWGAENYESYLRRPDIQSYRNQLAQLLTSSK